MTVTDQLTDELHAAASPWGAVCGPALVEDMEAAISRTVPVLATQLGQDYDDRLSAQTVIDLMAVLGDRDAAWYGQTPLGRAVARSAGSPLGEAVSYSVAAAMLGVTKTRIQQLLTTGKLAGHPDGGIQVGSILNRIRVI